MSTQWLRKPKQLVEIDSVSKGKIETRFKDLVLWGAKEALSDVYYW